MRWSDFKQTKNLKKWERQRRTGRWMLFDATTGEYDFNHGHSQRDRVHYILDHFLVVVFVMFTSMSLLFFFFFRSDMFVI